MERRAPSPATAATELHIDAVPTIVGSSISGERISPVEAARATPSLQT